MLPERGLEFLTPAGGARNVRHRALRARQVPRELGMFGFDRITANPNILGGKPCIRGMRISVALIVNLVANGMTVSEIIGEYPDTEEADVRQALRYAAWAAEDIVYLPASART